MNQHYLEMAEKNLPPMFYEKVTTKKAVVVKASDAAHLGFVTEDAGEIPEVVKGGDSFVLDFGRFIM